MADVMDATNQERAKRVAVERIVGFAKQFDEVHLNLACHAAFPLILTPDLLYQIWAHFVPEAPWSGVARVLLSRLFRQVGYEMYEMDIAVRNLLLRELKEQFGQERLEELAEFLMDYVAQQLTNDDADTRDLREAQEWTALAYTKPDEAARELALALSEKVKLEYMGEVLRLTSLVETLAEPLVEGGFEPLLVYSRGMESLVRGDVENAKSELSKIVIGRKQLQIAGITLKIPLKKQNFSSIYVERPPIESRCYELISRPGAILIIKAPRQMGKSSLLRKILEYAENQNYATAIIDLQLAENDVLRDSNKFLRWFCLTITQELGIISKLDNFWKNDFFSSNLLCTNYFEDYLLPQINTEFVLAIDETDSLFLYPNRAQDFFSLLRAWNQRAYLKGQWKKLRIVMVSSGNFLEFSVIHSSPLSNVGYNIELPEFNANQIDNLAQHYGLDWEEIQTQKLMAMVGGHPYLVTKALECIKNENITLEYLLQTAPTDAGIYRSHLEQHFLTLQNYPELAKAFAEVVNSTEPIRLKAELTYKLNSMGLVKLKGNDVIPRCNFYRQYFHKRFAPSSNVGVGGRRLTYGSKVKKRVMCLLESLLAYVDGEISDSNDLDINYYWQTENQLVIRTKLKSLEEITAIYRPESKLTKEQVREALCRMRDFLGILVDTRTKTQGYLIWDFRLNLWSIDKTENLVEFEKEWNRRIPNK